MSGFFPFTAVYVYLWVVVQHLFIWMGSRNPEPYDPEAPPDPDTEIV
jgi:hypothetical protein